MSTAKKPDEAARREQEFARWLAEGKVPEIRPGVQQRSVRMAFALLESGSELLRERAFDALSIEEICAGAGATVGAFYGRFEDKKSFFNALQRLTCLRSEAALAGFVLDAGKRKLSLAQLCEMMVGMSVDRYRSNIGIYRAALKHVDEGAWEPFRQLGDVYRRTLTDLLSPYLTHVPPKARSTRIRFAYQVMVGTLVHATLNDPGPVRLQDAAMTQELTEMVVRYLSV